MSGKQENSQMFTPQDDPDVAPFLEELGSFLVGKLHQWDTNHPGAVESLNRTKEMLARAREFVYDEAMELTNSRGAKN